MTQRRDFLLHAAALGGAILLPVMAGAQGSFPSKTVRIVVPLAPGGAADLTARTIAQAISGPLGQSVIVENKPGAGGVIAGEYVARAEPDGHTMLLVSSGTAVSEALFKKLPFDTLKDFAPVSELATFNLALVVADNSRFKNLNELLAYARENPGKLNIGTPQLGTTQHLAAELFKSTAGIDAQIVPFNGTPALINALRGQQVDVGLDIVGPLMGQISGKALRPLALLGDKTEAKLPGVPLARETGGPLANFNAASWNGLAVPAKTPQAAIDRLNKAINEALNQPEVKQKLTELTLHPGGSTPQQLGQRLASDIKRWGGVIERANIPKQ
ncbi:Bug family tripartite tricarboxylate transporter substrate binding protein [Ramlibacter rhizophilus]|uniref:Tripartite tricarboxylate transporter substrate binding protein n=1 Tax=Ramlibacter rhizophilus TaxID=1781167 RepID=A0A4Z0BCJ6_9BURK|nr:tripartite tricarboxylate transporter substrate binding protein [Ramlibacter rhizophilus]TFY96391.1 tripartite tricarboxylate transporter substrate binding protein [Ramlibacter rhizophilus]